MVAGVLSTAAACGEADSAVTSGIYANGGAGDIVGEVGANGDSDGWVAEVDVVAPDTCVSFCACAAAGTYCDDGNPCTAGERCQAGLGICANGLPVNCPGISACIQGQCDPSQGGCVWGPAPQETPCNDGNACTSSDACKGGLCQGKIAQCDDGNPCTADNCDPELGCIWPVIAAPCDDGDPCTKFDVCTAGSCAGLPTDSTSACNDGNPCTTDSCATGFGCVHSTNALPCDDGNACTTGDTCKGGNCQSGTFTCQCAQNLDCFPYEDGNACNGSLYCDKTAWPWNCKVNPKTIVQCADLGSGPCIANLCKPTTGQCVPGLSSGPCDDGLACTGDDHCENGLCAGSPPPSGCDDSNPCTLDGCSGDACTHDAVPDGIACDTAKVCKAGSCQAKCSLLNLAVGTTGTDDFYAVAGSGFGGWTAVGRSSGPGGTDGWIVEFNQEGSVMYQLFVDGGAEEQLRAVALPSDATRIAVGWSGSIAKGYSGFAVSYTEKGSIAWQKLYSGGNRRLHGLTPVDGGIVAVGQIDDGGSSGQQGLIMRLDFAGNVIWQSQIGFQSNDILYSVLSEGGLLYTAGMSFTAGAQGDGDGWLAQVDLGGQLIWQQQLGGSQFQSFAAVLPAGDAHLFLPGITNGAGSNYDGLLVATKLDGKQEWASTFGGAKDDFFNGAAVFSPGLIMVGGSESYSAGGDQDGLLVRVDGSGKMLWQKTLGTPGNDVLWGATSVANGGVVAVGTTAKALVGGKPGDSVNGWIVRVDSAADSSCN